MVADVVVKSHVITDNGLLTRLQQLNPVITIKE